jgi:hypothetical protein
MSYNVKRQRSVFPSYQVRERTVTINSQTVQPVLWDSSGKLMYCYGAVTMASLDSQTDFAKGCIFIKTDAAGGTEGVYRNTGTAAVSVFEALDSISAGEITLAEGALLVGNVGGVAAALDLGNVDGGIVIGNGTTGTINALTGDITLTNAGVTAVAALDLETATVTGIADTEIMIGTGATTANFAAVSGDATLANDGTLTISEGAVEDSMVEGLAAGQIILGVDGTAANNTKAVLSGDVTMDGTGAVTISEGAVEDSMIEGLADAQFIIGTDGTAANNTKSVMSGDATMTNAGVVTAKTALKTDLVTIAIPGTVAEFSFPFNNEVETEQAAAFAKVDDGGVFANLAVTAAEAGYTANYQLFPDTEVENDAAYFGGATPFGVIVIDIDTVATYGADSLAWEYWNGTAWSALTIVYDHTDSTAQDGLQSFQEDGHIIFSAPTDWAANTIDTQEAYWVRARCNATVNITQTPTTNSVEHKLISDPVAPEMPATGTIGRSRVTFTTNSASNNDTKIILCNLTSGACSAITTLTKALQINEVADFDLVVSTDDGLGIYIVQEDGTTEFADGTMEMKIVKT